MGIFDNDLLENQDYKMYMKLLHDLEMLKDPADLENMQNELKVHKDALIESFGKDYLELRKII